MGTPEFAIPSLEVVFKNTDLQLIFTKEDKRNARGNKIIFSPVKQFGIDNNVEIIQPRKMKDEEVINKIKEINPDLIVVVAYGKCSFFTFAKISGSFAYSFCYFKWRCRNWSEHNVY